VYSNSVALQALTVISMGGIVDHRKLSIPESYCPPPKFSSSSTLEMNPSSALFHSGLTVSIIVLPTSTIWWFSALLAICANIGFSASIVAMNAYLPSLALDSPEVAQVLLKHQGESPCPTGGLYNADGDLDLEENDSENPNAPLIAPRLDSAVRSEYDATISHATSCISSQGIIALGYGAGILLLIIALIPVTLLQGSMFSLRLAIGLSGLWWIVFTVPAAIWLPGRIWPPKPDSGGIQGIGM
jgi:UMF1 family MFS transporter